MNISVILKYIGNIRVDIGNIYLNNGNIRVNISNIHLNNGNMHVTIGNIGLSCLLFLPTNVQKQHIGVYFLMRFQNIIWHFAHFAKFPPRRIKFLPVGILIFAEFQEEFGNFHMEFVEFHSTFGKFHLEFDEFRLEFGKYHLEFDEFHLIFGKFNLEFGKFHLCNGNVRMNMGIIRLSCLLSLPTALKKQRRSYTLRLSNEK